MPLSTLHLWMDRLGLILQYLAFWLVAPEILGEHNLRRLGKGMATFLGSSIFLVLSLGVFSVVWSLFLRESLHWLHRLSWAVVESVILLIPLYFLARRIHRVWVPKFIQHVSTDELLRRTLGMVGAGFFTLGFFLQIAATFI
ncbi:MAG: hypothetical protein JST40_08185 [Armatimonadetes bacterium]|nr:hypothetical protein [Armatimonadota bacterium]